MNKRFYQILVLILLVVVAVLLMRNMKPKSQPQTTIDNTITDFASCQQAGGTLIDGDPVVCMTSDGRKFEEAQNVVDVIVDTPQPNALVTSPLTVKGRARGSWYFEANLPVELKDANGNVLAQKGFQAQSDWMTTNMVDFNDTLTFTMPTTQFGSLIIKKDNPSGLPQNDSAFAVPVKFW